MPRDGIHAPANSPSHRFRPLIGTLVLFVAAVLSGCTAYREMPLGKAIRSERLAAPNMERVRIRAAVLDHPLLKPVRFDERDGLSPDEAAVLAVLANPELRAVRDRRGIAASQLLQAGILPNPELGFSLETPISGNTGGQTNAFGLDLSWDVHSLVARSARVAAARAHAAAVDLEVAWQEWQVAEDAKRHLYRLAITEKQLAEATRLEKTFEDACNTTSCGVDSGALTALDLALAQTTLQEARIGVVHATSAVEMERQALNRTLGRPPEHKVKTQVELPTAFRREPPSSRELTKQVEERRLDLQALRLGYQSQEARVRAAVRSQFPRISLGVSATRDTDRLGTAGPGITFELPFFDRGQGDIMIERATRRQLFDEYTARLFEARADIARIVAGLRSVHRRIAAVEKSIAALEELSLAYSRGADSGRADVFMYFQAAERLGTKKLERFGLQQRQADLAIALELAAGAYLFTDDSAGAPAPGGKKHFGE